MKYISKTYKAFTAEQFDNPISKEFALHYMRLAGSDSMPPPALINPFRGVTIVIGGTHSGKSKFVGEFSDLLANDANQLVAHFSLIEPTVDKYAHQLSHPAMVTIEQFLEELKDALAAGVTTMVVDSFRVLQYSIGGQAVSGGMSTGVFALLTQLSELCYQTNIALIIPLNPNVKDDLYDFTVKNLKGSTHNIIDIESSEFSFRDLDRGHNKYRDIHDLKDVITSDVKETGFMLNELAVTHFKVSGQPNIGATSNLVDAVPAFEVKTKFMAKDDPNTSKRIIHLNNI